MAEASSAVILVCDDDPDTRGIISHALRAYGYQTVLAEDGVAAQELVMQSLPDLIVIDIMMPRMTGTEFVQWFRGKISEPFVPVLFLTALDETEDLVKGLSIGANDYLTKPFQIKEMLARVQAHLRIKVLTDQLIKRSKELADAQSLLLQKERELVVAQLAGGAAHSLGQPLTAILAYCRLLEVAKDKQEDAITGIRRECETIKQVLQSLERVDPARTQSYLGNDSILDLSSKE